MHGSRGSGLALARSARQTGKIGGQPNSKSDAVARGTAIAISSVRAYYTTNQRTGAGKILAKTERRFRGDGTAAPCRRGSRRCGSGLGDLAGPDARRADAHALDVALAVGDAHRAQVGQEAPLRDAGGVQADAALVLGRALADDDVARRRALAADFANSGHCSVPFV